MSDQTPVGLDRRLSHDLGKPRLEILQDAQYFADELAKRIEALAGMEGHGETLESWRQAAKLVRNVRGLCRHQADEQRHRRRVKAQQEGRKARVIV